MRGILRAGLRAADPFPTTRDALRALLERGRLRPRGRLVALAAGKAALPMARAARSVLGARLEELLVVTHANVGRAPAGARVMLAAHPVPDARSVAAARKVLALAAGLRRDDLLLVLLSGGASALLCAPAAGLSLADKRATTRLLLACGASIDEINTVRRHLSAIKGGGLARAADPARVETLALSDVLGADPAAIASGPLSPDPTTFADARAVLVRHRLLGAVPAAVAAHLAAGLAGRRQDTAKPGDAAFRRVSYRIVGDNATSLRACAAEARRRGLRVRLLAEPLRGEAREVGFGLGTLLREERPPCVLLAGGETTVSVRGAGRGGRNHELALGAALALADAPLVACAASLATDGLDGTSGAAGAMVDDRTLARAAALGLPPPEAALSRSDTAPWLAAVGATLVTGPTLTNVCDLVALAALPARESRRRRL